MNQNRIVSIIRQSLVTIIKYAQAQTKPLILGVLMGVLLLFVFYKMTSLIYSQEGDRLRAWGKTFYKNSTHSIAPDRGTIYADDGRPVAIMSSTYSLRLDFNAKVLLPLHDTSLRLPEDSIDLRKQKRLKDSLSRELDKLAYALDSIYKTEGVKFERKKMREQWRKAFQSRKQPLITIRGKELSYLQNQYLNDHIFKESILAKLRVEESRSQRLNPFGSLALRTIGAVYGIKDNSGFSQGKNGIELQYDSLLRGVQGTGRTVYVGAGTSKKGVKVVVKPSQTGANVYTTLDMHKQYLLENIMRRQLAHFSAKSGTAILMEVKTGKILAMTNLERSKGDHYAETRNMAVADQSEPGSTFKVASMLVALNDGVVSPNDTIEIAGGLWQVGGRTVRDHNASRGGYGRLSASQVIENSSNVGTAKIIHKAYAHKPDEFVDKVRALGFGYNLGIEIPGSARAIIRKRSDNPARWYNTTLAWMSFGYETQIPPLYTLSFFNAIANNGRFMKPYLVREVRSSTGEILEQKEPTTLIDSIASPRAIRDMQEMLRMVVVRGTGKSCRSDVVAISGKSGTAQIARGGSYHGAGGPSHEASFCGFFPSENPRYTLMVVVREPSKDFAAGGGSMAGPVVKELAEAIISMEQPSHLDSLGIKSQEVLSSAHIASGRKSELLPLLRATKVSYSEVSTLSDEAMLQLSSSGKATALPHYQQGIVPNVVGMSASDAYYLLLSTGLRPRLLGYGNVTGQSPSAGTKVKTGARIDLQLK